VCVPLHDELGFGVWSWTGGWQHRSKDFIRLLMEWACSLVPLCDRSILLPAMALGGKCIELPEPVVHHRYGVRCGRKRQEVLCLVTCADSNRLHSLGQTT